MRSWRFTVVVVAFLVCPAAQAQGQTQSQTQGPTQGQPSQRASTPTGPVLRLGALLPLTGPGAWFGAEIRQGLDLAVAEFQAPPAPRRTAPPARGGTSDPSTSPAEDAPEEKADPEAGATAPDRTGEGDAEPASPGVAKPRGGQSREAIEAADRPRTVSLAVQALNVQPLDLRAVESEANRLLASGVAAVLTASPTPTLTVYPLATARNVLVLHAGLPTDRFPAASRSLLQLRPSPAARADVLGAHAWERGIRRLGLLAGGDAFGRAVRAGVAARWRQQGGHLAHDESLSLDAADLRSRLRALARTAPEAVVLGFQGRALGEAARALRDAGYAGRLLAADDDRAALLAGGRALDGALILADAFVPEPGSRGARFARAYETRHGKPPSRFAASAYEAAVFLVEVAGRAVQGGRSLSGSRLRDTLVAEARFPSLYAGDVVVRDDGTLGRPLTLFRVEGDRLSFETYVGVDGRALGAPQGRGPSLPRLGLFVR